MSKQDLPGSGLEPVEKASLDELKATVFWSTDAA